MAEVNIPHINLPNLPTKAQIRAKMREWYRVMKLARKPRRAEFINVAKITGLGILVVGFLGFIIKLLSYYATLIVK
ncbi:preprotein translocase subunit SecE [archaeon]|nr:preprotein translocase subunit SecE [archaeon]